MARLYTVSLTIIESNVVESKWHVDWFGIPDQLSWTLLVPIWPAGAADWSQLGGTQLCLQQPELPRASTVPKAAKASAQTVLKEVSNFYFSLISSEFC